MKKEHKCCYIRQCHFEVKLDNGTRERYCDIDSIIDAGLNCPCGIIDYWAKELPRL